MTLRLGAGAAERIASGHAAAAETIDAAAGSVPVGVDAGRGSAYVSEILAAVCETAGEIALVNAAIAAAVRDAAADVGMTEEAVGQTFDSMARIGR